MDQTKGGGNCERVAKGETVIWKKLTRGGTGRKRHLGEPSKKHTVL